MLKSSGKLCILSISSLRSSSMRKEIPLCWLSKQYVFLVKTPCSLDWNMVMIEIYENYIPQMVISSHVVLQPANARKPRLILVDMSPWQIRNALRCILGWGLETVPSARSRLGPGMSPCQTLGHVYHKNERFHKVGNWVSKKKYIYIYTLQFLTKVEWFLHVFTTKWGGSARFQANWNGALRKLTQIWACHSSQQPIDRPLLTGIWLEL